MKIAMTQYRRCDVVKPAGRIDSQTTPRLKEALDKIVEEGRFRIILDLSEVDFMSSSGIWALLETQKACKRWNRGEVVIANANKNIQRTLEIAGLKHFLRMFGDVLTAVGSF